MTNIREWIELVATVVSTTTTVVGTWVTVRMTTGVTNRPEGNGRDGSSEQDDMPLLKSAFA